MKYTKSYRKVIRFDEQMWGGIKEFFGVNFTKVHAVITLRDDMGMINEKIDYVYGYIKKSSDNIKSIALYGQQGDMQVSMTFYTSKNISPISLRVEAENIDSYTKEKINSAIKNLGVIPRKFALPYFIIKCVVYVEIYIVLMAIFVLITQKEIWAALLGFLVATPFWFIVFAFDYIIKMKETGDDWIQFWVDEEHIEKYKNMRGWRIWPYIVMGMIVLLPFVAWFLFGR